MLLVDQSQAETSDLDDLAFDFIVKIAKILYLSDTRLSWMANFYKFHGDLLDWKKLVIDEHAPSIL